MSEINWHDPKNWAKLKYNKQEATRLFSEFEVDNITLRDFKPYDEVLRESLYKPLITAYEDLESVEPYKVDLQLGLTLYQVLKEELAFNERLAAQDDLWRYLSIKILPDLVYKRFGLNEDRFYKQSRRIWLKAIWWYIHLSWQGTIEDTRRILSRNTTDTISQLVERTSTRGYRVELSRILMKKHAEATEGMNAKDRTLLFRKISKLTTARIKLIEPAFVVGGLEGYVNELYQYFIKK